MATDESSSANESKSGFLRRHWRLLVALGILLLLLFAAYWWFFKRNKVTTDDAYVHIDNAQISSRIPGTVWRVLVHNDYPVEVGQTLVQLDPTAYAVAVSRAEAVLVEAEGNVQAAEVSISLTDAQTTAAVEAARAAFQGARDKERQTHHQLAELQSQKEGVLAELALAQRDFQRFAALYRQGAGSERRREEAQTTLKKSQSQLGSLEAQMKASKASLAAVAQEASRAKAQLQSAQSARSNVEIEKHKLASLKGKRDKAQAELEAARLNLSYTNITAPITGYIAQKNLQAGDRIQPGQALMAVVPLQQAYIEANFKETQLNNVRVGQPATITADIYPDYTYHGHVAGIRAGTGAAFSLLPPENATGNWIKVVRRVPVKIYLDKPPPPEHPLRMGLSMVVTIDASDQSGPMLVPRKDVPAPVFSAPASPIQP